MADGILLNVGAGGSTADTEQIASRSNAHLQRMKLVMGALDSDGGDVGSVSGAMEVTTGGKTTASLTASGVVKASAGRLCKVLVTTVLGAGVVTLYDNATTNSGTIIGYLAASTAAGTMVTFDMPAANGIYASLASTGTITISFD